MNHHAQEYPTTGYVRQQPTDILDHGEDGVFGTVGFDMVGGLEEGQVLVAQGLIHGDDHVSLQALFTFHFYGTFVAFGNLGIGIVFNPEIYQGQLQGELKFFLS